MILPATLKGSYIERMSDEEFFNFCQDNRDFKFERTSDGQIILMSPTYYVTGRRNSEILLQLFQWNKQNKLGECVDSDTGFYLPNSAMRNPDAAWISQQQLKKVSQKEKQSFLHLCPDFIVELKSTSDRIQDLKAKMKEWMENGCRLGWLIDAEEEIVYVYYNGQEITHNGFDTPLSAEPVLPGFSLILSELRV
jgi:Uma2 family endonuclease